MSAGQAVHWGWEWGGEEKSCTTLCNLRMFFSAKLNGIPMAGFFVDTDFFF